MGSRSSQTTARVRQLVLESAAYHNVLPVTSACNTRCLFCSHSLPYPHLDVHRLSPVDADLVEEAVLFLSPERKVIIGESATRLIEGEPFTHPRFFAVLAAVRRRLPDTPIQVTTNGTLLDAAAVSRLASFAPIRVSLSLNCSRADLRRAVMRDADPDTALTAPERLSRHGLPFEVSVVAIPGVVDVGEISETVEFAAARGASRAKVYVAGCSEPLLRRNGWRRLREKWTELVERLERWRLECSLPVTLQPPRLRNLEAEVCGVFPGSPAAAAGIQAGDILARIDGKTVESRSHANELLGTGDVGVVTVRRGSETLILNLGAGVGTGGSGVVLDEDLDRMRLRRLQQAVNSAPEAPALVLTSQLAEPLLRAAVNRVAGACGATVAAAESRLFGGTIACAGLLTNACFIACAQRLLHHARARHGRVVLPAEAFDRRGCDLTGRSYLQIQETLGLPVSVI